MTTVFQSQLTSKRIEEVIAPTLSAKYIPISTNEVCDALEELGFVKREVKGGGFGKNGGTKVHSVRMVFGELQNVAGDLMRPEIVITNSFDGKSAFKVKAGIFRQVCSNGLTVLAESVGEIKLRHTGDVAELAMQIVEEMAEKLPAMMELIAKMRGVKLNEKQAIAFAMGAARIRWNKEFNVEQARVLLEAARPEDTGLGLWEVFNVVQERVLSTQGLQIPGMRRAQIIKNPIRYEKINGDLFKLALENLN